MGESPRRHSADVLVLVSMVYPTVGAWIYFLVLGGSDLARYVYLASKGIQLALPLLWLAVVRQGMPRPRRPRLAGLAAGFGSGLAVSGLLLGLYFLWLAGSDLAVQGAARISSKLTDFHITTPLAFLGLAAALSLAHSWFEEMYWRWFVFRRLRAWLPPAGALTLASAAFAAHHAIVLASFVPPGHLWTLVLPGTVAVALGGALWCHLFRRYGGLASPWLSHLLVDVALMLVGYWLVW